MQEIISKEIARKFMQIKGEVRGLALKSHGEFIFKEKGLWSWLRRIFIRWF